MRKPLLVTAAKEKKLIVTLTNKVIEKYSELSPDNTLVIMVSPDYSATVAMHIAHNLSVNPLFEKIYLAIQLYPLSPQLKFQLHLLI